MWFESRLGLPSTAPSGAAIISIALSFPKRNAPINPRRAVSFEPDTRV